MTQPGEIDVVIPVFNAAADLARCVDSVLACTPMPYRLVLIDDGSTEPAVATCFDALGARGLPQVLLLANERNLGFTLTANRGMALSKTADVVLLNSDTVVTDGWLSKLRRCVASDPAIGTVTPFSNNAEICSLPEFCRNNPWPLPLDPEPMNAALGRASAPTYPDLPTGVGFCLLVRRRLIEAIGSFDEVFGLGYGEENDLCMRAAAAGFRNVLCDDAFVLHLGGSSFGALRPALSERNTQILLDKHPHYETLVRSFIERDPLGPMRRLALSQYRVLTGSRHGVLHVIHGHGGGTEYHVRALIAASQPAFRHYLLIAVGDEWQLEEHFEGRVQSFDFSRLPGESWKAFLGALGARFGVDLIHVHNISGCREGLLEALVESGLPYGYTVHDLNFACPTITFLSADGMYCGARTEPAICQPCLAAQPQFAGIDIVSWRASHRALLARAAFVIAPSQWAADVLNRYFPEHRIDVVPHGTPTPPPSRSAGVRNCVLMHDDGVPVVAVLGAIGPDKGARRLERLVGMTREQGLRLRWVLIGYLDCQRTPHQDSDAVFTVHGRYEIGDLPDLLAHYGVRLVAFPSACPETFSFTLSESWTSGLPVVVPPIGALAERVAQSGGGWILSDDEWRSDARMLARIATVLEPARADEFAAIRDKARSAPLASRRSMADATVAIYARTLAAAPAREPVEPIAPERCLAALGYVSWSPPAPPAPPAPEPEPTVQASVIVAPMGLLARLAHAALRIRRTVVGRMLYRITPRPILAALKARLS